MDDKFHVSAKAVVTKDESMLLIEYQDAGEVGHHYNLPGGRIRPNERADAAVLRKLQEEAGAVASSGPLLFVYEYIGVNHNCFCGDKHSISLVFQCFLLDGYPEPSLASASPAHNQTGVRWIPLSRLDEITLWPSCVEQIRRALARPDTVPDRYWGDVL